MTPPRGGRLTPGIDYTTTTRTQVRAVCLRCGWPSPWRLTTAQAAELMDAHRCNPRPAKVRQLRHE